MMKTASLTAADASSSRRSQPVRQARTNPARSSSHGGRREPLGGGAQGDQPIDIFPAITHFADAMSALPKEIIRHFTLLKEVDAKIFAPEDHLFALVAATTNSSPNTKPTTTEEASDSAVVAAPLPSVAVTEGANGPVNGAGSTSTDEPANAATAAYDPSNLQRRQLFRQTAFKIQELLVSLEEKNHVLSTANEALQRQLARVDDVWPHLLNEFTDEAKWGSLTHWAYPENRMGRSSLAEKTRRDGAAAISAAAQALADEAAARSDARKQALQAKKGVRNNQHLDSDFDDHDTKPAKKTSHAKGRKTAEGNVTGLGISNAGPTNGNPPQKRRKVEKTPNGGVAMERAPSGVAGAANAHKAKVGSPAETPAPDGSKKRKALPTGSGQPKKRYSSCPSTLCLFVLPKLISCCSRNNGSGMSPSIASSPVLSNLPDPKTLVRASPNPTSAARPTTARARGNSIHSNAENGKAKLPPMAAVVKPNGKAVPPIVEVGAATTRPKPSSDAKITKEVATPIKQEVSKKEAEKPESTTTVAAGEAKIDNTKTEEIEKKNEPIPPLPMTMATVTTKSGRASKPSTPALQQFQDAAALAAARPRSSRNNDNSNNGHSNGAKKHQKRASTASAALAAKVVVDEDTNSSVPGDDDEEEIDANEPTYCYCNSVSYGEMVACDADECEREWFHLACVGLKTAPGQKSKLPLTEPCAMLRAGLYKLTFILSEMVL